MSTYVRVSVIDEKASNFDESNVGNCKIDENINKSQQEIRDQIKKMIKSE